MNVSISLIRKYKISQDWELYIFGKKRKYGQKEYRDAAQERNHRFIL